MSCYDRSCGELSVKSADALFQLHLSDAPWCQCRHLRSKVNFADSMRLLISDMIPSEERLKKTADELSAATGRSCLAVRVDVRDPKQVQAAVKQTVERYGRIDFVINGNCPPSTLFLSISN
jgi:hypothetical protein